MQSGNWDTSINKNETQAIIERAAQLEPTIKASLVLKIVVPTQVQ